MHHLYPVPLRRSRWMTSWQRCRRLNSQTSARHPREVGPASGSGCGGAGVTIFCAGRDKGIPYLDAAGIAELRCRRRQKEQSVFMCTQGSLGMIE